MIMTDHDWSLWSWLIIVIMIDHNHNRSLWSWLIMIDHDWSWLIMTDHDWSLWSWLIIMIMIDHDWSLWSWLIIVIMIDHNHNRSLWSWLIMIDHDWSWLIIVIMIDHHCLNDIKNVIFGVAPSLKDKLVYADLCRFVFCRPPQDPSEFPKQSLAPALWHGFQRVHHIVDPGVVHRAALAGLHCLEPDIHLAVSFIGSVGPNRVPQKIVWMTLQKLGGKFTDLRVQTLWGP